MKSEISVLTFIIGLVLADVVIEPQNSALRHGDLFQVTCKSSQEIGQCLWEVNGELYIPAENSKYKPYGDIQQGECGIQTVISEIDNGVWKCQVFPKTGGSAARASSNVTVIAVPRIELKPLENPITAAANRETEFTCTLQNARPAPSITWMLGDREIESTAASVASESIDGFYTVTNTLRYSLRTEDHNQMIRCLAVGSWFTPEDQREANAQLNVQFPPQPKDEVIMYGLVEGQPGELSVNFTANPRPYRVYWLLDENTQIAVDLNGQSQQEGDQVTQLIEGGDNSYEARLRIPMLTEADAARQYQLVVNSELDGLDHVERYTVKVSLSQPTESEEYGLTDGGIAAIIIILLLLVAIAAVVLFARHTGRWCFAGRHGGTSQSAVDEENQGEWKFVKEQQGIDGPMTSTSMEDINLGPTENGFVASELSTPSTDTVSNHDEKNN